MDMQQPPDVPAITMPAGASGTFTTDRIAKLPPSVAILIITAEGRIERHGTPIEQLSKDDLLTVVRELVDLMRKR